ncbi:MAG: SURF1 family protein [Gammaproteobacteria bacterium]|nr:SURF1 family protein [Gammaproteobacteria bacterium]
MREAGPARPLSTGGLALLAAIAALLFAGLVALGQWQIQRRAWKLDLIARVEAHLQAAPVAAPGPAAWSAIGKPDEYRRLRVDGEFLHERETCVQAVTVRGPGCWVLTPLRTRDGFVVLVNRGFVEPERRPPAARAQGQIGGAATVSGLLRLTEPGGGFLRRNDPAANRWYSRDVAAIAAARGVPDAAPYFIDADATVAGGPIGGLTVVRFRNSHLIYALTWYGLATMVALGAGLVARREWRLRRGS